MKTVCRVLSLLPVVLALVACGYHNPNIYSGSAKTIYMNEWKNRTSELGLNSDIYRSLTRWFQKSEKISTVQKREGADLALSGEIVSLDLPSLSFGANSITTEVKVILQVRYVLKDIATNKILFEIPAEIWTEEYLVSANASTTLDNEQGALATIIEDLSKKIYHRTLRELHKL